MIEREKKRIKLYNRYQQKREILKHNYKFAKNYKEKFEIHTQLQNLPRNSSRIRQRNRCWKTGRPRGVFRDFGLSRHAFREMAHQCLLPGITKSSW